MNPFYFGPSADPLYGVYHPPRSSEARASGVVLCYPAAQEYMRAHRAFRQLAGLLSRAGFHTLRFDYFGTGDSDGDGEACTTPRWIEDVGTAVEELKDTTDVETVAIVGLRLGATVAAMAAMQRTDVSHLVFWDPVVSGSAYVEELLAHGDVPHAVSSNGHGGLRGDVVGVMGFPFTRTLREGIAALDMQLAVPGTETETLIVVSEERDEYVQLAATFRERGADTSFRGIPSDGNWNEVDDFGSALIPQAIIREIVSHLSARVTT